MAAHTTEQFNLFMSQLRETNATLEKKRLLQYQVSII